MKKPYNFGSLMGLRCVFIAGLVCLYPTVCSAWDETQAGLIGTAERAVITAYAKALSVLPSGVADTIQGTFGLYAYDTSGSSVFSVAQYTATNSYPNLNAFPVYYGDTISSPYTGAACNHQGVHIEGESCIYLERHLWNNDSGITMLILSGAQNNSQNADTFYDASYTGVINNSFVDFEQHCTATGYPGAPNHAFSTYQLCFVEIVGSTVTVVSEFPTTFLGGLPIIGRQDMLAALTSARTFTADTNPQSVDIGDYTTAINYLTTGVPLTTAITPAVSVANPVIPSNVVTSSITVNNVVTSSITVNNNVSFSTGEIVGRLDIVNDNLIALTTGLLTVPTTEQYGVLLDSAGLSLTLTSMVDNLYIGVTSNSYVTALQMLVPPDTDLPDWEPCFDFDWTVWGAQPQHICLSTWPGWTTTVLPLMRWAFFFLTAIWSFVYIWRD